MTDKEKINKCIEELEQHIAHCEMEATHSLHNEVCHISLKFDKRLLAILKGDKDDDLEETLWYQKEELEIIRNNRKYLG